MRNEKQTSTVIVFGLQSNLCSLVRSPNHNDQSDAPVKKTKNADFFKCREGRLWGNWGAAVVPPWVRRCSCLCLLPVCVALLSCVSLIINSAASNSRVISRTPVSQFTGSLLVQTPAKISTPSHLIKRAVPFVDCFFPSGDKINLQNCVCCSKSFVNFGLEWFSFHCLSVCLIVVSQWCFYNLVCL